MIAATLVTGALMRSKLAGKAIEMGLPEHDRAQAFMSAPGNYLRSVFSGEKPEALFLDIKFKHIKKIQAIRDNAIALDVLNSSGDDFVPATIRHKDRSIQVKLRLKGDNTDHLQGNKWSFLVKTRGGDQLFGMRRFSLMNPSVRGDQQEPMAYALLRKMNLIAPRYDFVDLTINGRRIGIMALEEYPAKEMLESQGRRESVVVRFDESQFWDDLAHKGYIEWDFSNYATTLIKAAQDGKVRKSPKLSKNLKVATGLLKAHIQGGLPAAQVFNIDEMARFLAALEILHAKNGFWWGNKRFYYNPISANLEPVGSDLMSETNWNDENELYVLHSMMEDETRAILRDPDIRKAFVKELQQLVKDVEDGSIEAFLRPLDDRYLDILYRDQPLLGSFDFDRLKLRAAHLAKVTVDNLDYFNSLEEVGHAYIMHAQNNKGSQEGQLELTNIISAPLEIVDINWRAKSGETPVLFQPNTQINYPLILNPTIDEGLPRIVKIPYTYSPELDGLQIEVVARIKGTERTYLTTASSNFSSLQQRPLPDSSLSEILDKHYFIRQLDDSTLSVIPGRHEITDTISIPTGYELQVQAGTTLLFATDASLIVNGPLNMLGTENEAIVLNGLENSEGEVGWRGLVVLGARAPSQLNHVQISNTTGVLHGDWELTGGVTFYESKVRIENVLFENNRAEDALNIIRSDFEIKDIVIRNTVSDAFDSDFSRGSVVGGLFENIGTAGGGDAIDISGSVVSVTGTRFNKVDDKALSVGEGSEMIATGVQINGALTGAASKDASRLEISSSKITGVRIAGMMAYVKKPEYGPSAIDATDVEFSDTAVIAMAQTGSEIQIGGKAVPTSSLDVDGLYNSYMKKASRQ